MKIVKQLYVAPAVEIIRLDSEISLVLNSYPPEGINESNLNNSTPDYFNPNESLNA